MATTIHKGARLVITPAEAAALFSDPQRTINPASIIVVYQPSWTPEQVEQVVRAAVQRTKK